MPLQGKIAVRNFYGYTLFTVFLWFKAAKIIQFKGIVLPGRKPKYTTEELIFNLKIFEINILWRLNPRISIENLAMPCY
jgi:hypothetical protein